MGRCWNAYLLTEFGTQRHLVDIVLAAVRRLTGGAVRLERRRRYVLGDIRATTPAPFEVPVSFALAGPGDDLLDYLALGEDTPERLQSRREKHNHLLLGRSESGVAFFAWFRILRQAGDGPEYVYIHTCFTIPEWRGRGIYKAGLRFILSWAADSGVAAASIDVAENNVPSIRAIERCGFVLKGHYIFAVLFGRTLSVMSPRLKACGPTSF